MTLSHQTQVGQGPPLVCVHGAGGNHHVYDGLRAAMPLQHIVAVDAPGRLGSTGPAPASVREVVAAVRRFASDNLNEDYVVLGHSVGGATAIELGLQDPRVRGVVLVATGARLRVHPMIFQALEHAVEQGLPQPDAPGLWMRDTPAALIAAYKQLEAKTPTSVALSDWHMANGFDRLTDVHRIQVPTLVVSGTDDPLTPEKYGRYLAEQIPGAMLALLKGAGHMLPIEHAPALAAKIDAFLDALNA